MKNAFVGRAPPEKAYPNPTLIAQVLNVVFGHPEKVSDLVEYSDSNLFAQLGGIGKVPQKGVGKDGDLIGKRRRIEGRALGERDAFIEAVKRVFTRIEAHRPELAWFGLLFDRDHDIVESPAKLGREAVEHANGLFLQLVVGN